MPVLEKVAKYKHAPKTLIFQGANVLGVELARLLIEQGAFVIIVDEYTEKKKQVLASLLGRDLFSFVDISGIGTLTDSLEKLDYIFYLNNDIGDAYNEVSTSEFLVKCNTLDKLLQMGVNKGCKFLLASSIRVHSILQAKKDISDDVSVSDDALKYTTLEVQRYAENLTWEYYKRGGLDARIVRVGELLGEGIDLHVESTLVAFLRAAMKGKKIKVEGDGLESLYFIHVLDAAYGLIKAQFSPHTAGEIFSLVIPRDITILNLAYKILDFIPKATGIDFVEKKIPAEYTVYQPAPNLKTIGWKPKVSFERALAQTIDYAYKVAKDEEQDAKPLSQHVEEKQPHKENQKKVSHHPKEKSLKNFLIDFLFEVKDEKKAASVLDSAQFSSYKGKTSGRELDQGKTSRVFLEDRKGNDGNKIKSHLTLITQIKNKLRSMTVTSFLFYFFSLIAFLLIYFLFGVPIFRSIYYGKQAYNDVLQAQRNINDWEFSDASNNLKKSSDSLLTADTFLKRIPLLTLIKYDDEVSYLRDIIQKGSIKLDAARVISEGIIPLEGYINTYESNIRLVGNDDLTVVEDKNNYSLSQLKDVGVRLENVRANLTEDTIQKEDTNIPFIQIQVDGIIDNLETISSKTLSSIDFVTLTPSLLSVDKSTTTALLLLDSRDLTPKGGRISSVCVLTVDKGIIKNIKMYSADEINLSISIEQDKLVRDDVKLLYPQDGLKFKDLTLLQSDDMFVTLVKSAIGTKFGTNVDQLVTLDTEALKDALTVVGSITTSQQGIISSSNVNEKIQNGEVPYKELFVKVIEKFFNFKKEGLEMRGLYCMRNLLTKNIVLYTEDKNYKQFLKNNGLNQEQQSEMSEEMKLAFVAKSLSLPEVTVNSKILIEGIDTDTEYMITYKTQDADFTGIGIITVGKDFVIDEILPSAETIKLASSYADRIFLNLQLPKNSTQSVVVKGKSVGIVIVDQELYNYSVRLTKPYNFAYNYVFTIEFNDKFQLLSSPQDSEKNDSVIRVEGEVSQNKVFKFTFTPSKNS